jgi:hypothetical protein
MSDYEGITTPDPERERLFQSVFHPSPLNEVAEAVSAATEDHCKIYVEKLGDRFRWSFATRAGGPYPQLRITAQFLRMDYSSLRGVGSREVGDGFCVQIVDEGEIGPDAWALLTFDEPASAYQVGLRVRSELEIDDHP